LGQGEVLPGASAYRDKMAHINSLEDFQQALINFPHEGK
jgi:hypothetical protein